MKIILTVLSKPDQEALGALVGQLKRNRAEGIWIIHNPDLGIEGNDAAKSYNEQIARLNTDITSAVQREDFNAATELKTKRDAQMVERDLAVRQGWTKVDPQHRQAAHDRILSVFDSSVADNVMITCLQEVTPPEMTFDALLKFRGNWPEPLKHGEYVVGGPRAFLNGAAAAQVKPEVKSPTAVSASEFSKLPQAVKEVFAPAGSLSSSDPLPKVREGVPSISRSKFAILSKAEAASIARDLGGVGSENSTLASLKQFIESKGVVKAPQSSPFTKKA